ncbi:MAG: hypothetical protein WC582_03550 [Patescibacteria group bacterium]
MAKEDWNVDFDVFHTMGDEERLELRRILLRDKKAREVIRQKLKLSGIYAIGICGNLENVAFMCNRPDDLLEINLLMAYAKRQGKAIFVITRDDQDIKDI